MFITAFFKATVLTRSFSSLFLDAIFAYALTFAAF